MYGYIFGHIFAATSAAAFLLLVTKKVEFNMIAFIVIIVLGFIGFSILAYLDYKAGRPPFKNREVV